MRSAIFGIEVKPTAPQTTFKILALTIFLLAPIRAHSVPLPPVPPVPPIPVCKQDTLDHYIALANGCTLGAYTFTGFTYTFPGGVPAANQITLTPVDTFSGKPDGFEFAANPGWSLEGIGSSFYSFNYVVFGSAINAAAVSTNGVIVGDGSFEWDENLCLNGVFDATGACFFGTYDLIQALSNAIGAVDSTKFPSVGFIDVDTELIVTGTKNTDIETTASVDEQFAQAPVPEPPPIVLLMTALATMPWLLNRYRLHRS